MIFVKERKLNSSKSSIQSSRKYRGLNDLLTYLILLDDSTILHKDGALSRHYKYVAPDLASTTGNELDYHAKTWSDASQFLGNGWMIEVNVTSQPFENIAKPREFPEMVSALIDDERRSQYRNNHYFQTTYYLSVTWRPENKLASVLKKFTLNADDTKSSILDTLEHFNKQLASYTQFLKRSLLSLKPLDSSEVTSYLHHCISGINQSLNTPSIGCFLDCYLASEDFTGGFSPKIGNKFIKALAIDGLPAESFPCLLDQLSYIPLSYRWSNRFICLEHQTATAYLKRYERNWSSKAIGALGVVREAMGMPANRNDDAQLVADQLKAAQTGAGASELGYGFYNSTLILMHEDQEYLKKSAENIIGIIQQMDFRVRDETINSTESFLGSLPCHGDYNLRKMMVDTHYIGHAFPTSSVYQGECQSPCPKEGYHNQPPLLLTTTYGSRPFLFNLHVGDVGHTAILGPTGKGKSTLTAAIMMAHRKYPGSRIIVLDKDKSNFIPVKSLQGAYVDLGQSDYSINPLARISHGTGAELDCAMEWLVNICWVQGLSLTPEQKKELRSALLRLADEPMNYRNLNHLTVQDPIVREAINSFNQGVRQKLLNGTSDQCAASDVMGFDMSSFMRSESGERNNSIPVFQALFNEFDHLFDDKRPTLLILEEAWLYLKDPLFKEKLTDWFKTLRKANVAVIFISQDIDDIVQSDAASVIQNSCMTRVYLPNAQANEPNVAEQYKLFGLNDREIQIIAQAIPKQDYYYHSQLGRRLFSLDLGELSKAFLCVSQKSDIDQFKQLHQQIDSKWVFDWLTDQSLDEWRDYAEEQYG